MGRILVLTALVALVIGIAVVVAVARDRAARARGLALPPGAEPASYGNHLAMARWIEGRLADDMVRPLLPEAEQDRARGLLSEFYGDHE
jgi:hypothetical protein